MQAAGDLYLYIASEREKFPIAIYVDNIVFAGKRMKRMNTVMQALSQKFQVKDIGKLNYFLGVKVVQDYNAGSVDWTAVLHREYSKKIWYGKCQENSNSCGQQYYVGKRRR